MPFEFEKLSISGLVLVRPKFFADSRGFFAETYKKSDFVKNGIDEEFNQDNCSQSTQGVIRGLHYQLAPHAQAKLVRCAKGKIFDVAVDLRKDSPTYGKWEGVELSEENGYMLFLPDYCAHGFSVLSEEALVMYKSSREYCKDAERGIIYNDKDLNIDWKVDNPVISDKDAVLPSFVNADMNFGEAL